MVRQLITSAASDVDEGLLAFGRAPELLGRMLREMLDALEEQGHTAEEHDVEVRIVHLPGKPLVQVQVGIMGAGCDAWIDISTEAGRPYRVWCTEPAEHDGDHRVVRGHMLHTWPDEVSRHG